MYFSLRELVVPMPAATGRRSIAANCMMYRRVYRSLRERVVTVLAAIVAAYCMMYRRVYRSLWERAARARVACRRVVHRM